ncbi:MAG: family 10 glycosylhydrolase [Candidatus Omnitrophota bacterium]
MTRNRNAEHTMRKDTNGKKESVTAREWFLENKRRLLLDFHTPEWPSGLFTELNPQKIIKEFKRAHINAAYFSAKDCYGNSYYNTAVGHKHSALKDRDLLSEWLSAAHAVGIKAIAYYCISWDTGAAMKNPDWSCREPDGTPAKNSNLVSAPWHIVCLNSPYREYAISQVKEIAKNYDMDGIFLDMFVYHTQKQLCYCDYCKKKYREELGGEIPVVIDWQSLVWRRYLDWRSKCLRECIFDMEKLIRSVKPNVSFSHNFHGYWIVNWRVGVTAEEFTESADYVTGETEAMCPSQLARFMRGVSGGKHYDVMTHRFVQGWDYSIKPAEQLKFEIFTAAANGAGVTVIDQPYHTGRLEKAVYDILGEAYQEIEEREKWLAGAEPTKFIALYYSQKTKDYHGADNLEKYVPSFIGGYRALFEGHQAVDIVSDRHLNQAELNKYKVLVLSNAVCLSDRQVEQISEFVKNGGGLVATHLTSLANENYEFKDNFGLSEIFGCRFKRVSEFTDNYIKFECTQLTEGIEKRFHLHRGSTLEVIPTEDVNVHGWMVNPIGQKSAEKWYGNFMSPPGRVTNNPFVISNNYGKGKVVYISGNAEDNYARFGFKVFRQLLNNAVLHVAPEKPQIRIAAPLNVEVTFFEQKDKGRKILHFVNCPEQRRGESHYDLVTQINTGVTTRKIIFEETNPVYGIRVLVNGNISKTYLVPSMEKLNFTTKEGFSEITVPKTGLWGTVVIETEQTI